MSIMPTYDPLFSIRIWEYDTDEIRLSAMSNTRFVAHLKDVFHFERADIDRPRHRDRMAQPVWPPGLVFELGVGPVNQGEHSGEADEVAFRRLSIEADRISIEVAGKTAYADQLMDYIRFLLSEIRTPEGIPFIGEPARVKDFSLVVIHNAGLTMRRLFQPAVMDACKEHWITDDDELLLPEVSVRIGHPYQPVRLQDQPQWTIKPRFGVPPQKETLESHAGLSSDDHIAMLTRLHTSLSD